MSVTCGNFTTTSVASKGSALTCPEVTANFAALEALMSAYCQTPLQEYVIGHNANTITVTSDTLAYTATTFPKKIRLYYNGILQWNNALSGLTDGYTISVAGNVVTFTLSWTPTGVPGTPGVEDFLIEWDVFPETL